MSSFPADTLERIVAGREIVSAQLVVDWQARDEDHLDDVVTQLGGFLHAEYPNADKYPSPSPVVVLRAAERYAQITFGSLTLHREFSGAYRRDWELAARFIEQKWHPPLEFLIESGASIRSLGLIVTLQMSTEGYEGFDPHTFVTQFIRSSSRAGLIDAEVRMAFECDGRYLTNVGISSYRAFEDGVSTSSGGQPAVRQEVTDRGIQLKVDVNTRYPNFFLGESRDITPGELKRLVELAGDAVEGELRGTLEAARE